MNNIKREKEAPINNNIKANELFVIGPKGEKLGIKSKKDALTLAEYAGFDLVLINPTATPPVCKIMDYNKHKYETQKRKKESQKRQRETNLQLKEYRLSSNIDIGDFNTKLKNARKYLEKGHKVKISIRFKGREMVHTDRGSEVLHRFAKELAEIADIEKNPKLEGRFMAMFLTPKKQ